MSIQQRPRLAKKSENIVAHSLVGRLTRSLPLTRSLDRPVHVARLPPASFCETPLELASDTDALQSRLLISILAGGVIRGFSILTRQSNDFDFHICALG